MIGVNTNHSAMVALQALGESNRAMSMTQSAISSGFKVASAKDNGAVWAIANKMGSDVSAYDRVLESTDTAIAQVDLAIATGESMMEILNEMKAKALAGSVPGISTAASTALNAEFRQLFGYINSISSNATAGGPNLVSGAPAIALGDASGANNLVIDGSVLSIFNGILAIWGNVSVTNPFQASFALPLVETQISNLGTQLATWGAGAKRLAMHKQHITKLQASISTGKGALVDADIEKESAKLQAAQVKVQLGTQALSLANAAPQVALSLFRN